MKYNKNIRNHVSDPTSHAKVDVDILKRKIFQKKKREIMQSRIIIASAIVSLGVISYFAG